jgi:hypothetical protein
MQMQKAVQPHNGSEQRESAAKWLSLTKWMLILTFEES